MCYCSAPERSRFDNACRWYRLVDLVSFRVRYRSDSLEDSMFENACRRCLVGLVCFCVCCCFALSLKDAFWEYDRQYRLADLISFSVNWQSAPLAHCESLAIELAVDVSETYRQCFALLRAELVDSYVGSIVSWKACLSWIALLQCACCVM